MPRFHIRESFAIESRGLFVLAGSVLDGAVHAGMSVGIPFNAQLLVTTRIDSVEFARQSGGQEDTCLCIRCGPGELDVWRALNLRDEIVEVTSDAALSA